MPDPSFFSRLRTGLALPGITVAFTPARAATSHLRRRYQTRYQGRYRFPALLFAIDLSIVALIVATFGVAVWFSFWKPLPESGLELVFRAPPITTATTLAFEADVSVRDGRSHSDVRLRWILPAGTEVITASPPIDTRREALIGEIKPGEKRAVRLAVRIIAPPGSARIGFQLRSGDELLSGEEVRPIIGSALHLEPILTPTQAIPTFDVYALKNLGNTPIDCAQIHVDSAFPARLEAQTIYQDTRGARAIFDRIAAHEQRLIGIERSPGTIRVMCGGVELERIENSLIPKPSLVDQGSFELMPSTPGQETAITIKATEPLRVLVYHPLLAQANEGLRWFDVTSGPTRLTLPLDPGKQMVVPLDRAPAWMAWLVRPTAAGPELIAFKEAPITTPFTLTSEARYYAASGGQIGAGPLPPQAGKTTRYWLQWKLAPTRSDLSSLEIKATLPAGVVWTGQTALPNGGTFEEKEGQLIWRIPFLAATLEPTSAAFEVALTPTAESRNTLPLLISPTEAQALENRSSATVRAQAPRLDTSLPNDDRARGKGSVR